MSREKKKFKPVISRVKLYAEQAVLSCCTDTPIVKGRDGASGPVNWCGDIACGLGGCTGTSGMSS